MDLNLIVLSAMFPNKYLPNSGTFVYEQVKALRSLIKGKITVIVPVPWSPRCLWFNKKWKEYGKIEKEAIVDDIKIYYKKHLVIPGNIYFHFQGLFIYLSCLSLLKKLIKSNERRTILHTHAILPNGLAGALLARKLKIPHICTVHGSDINIYPFYSKISLALTKHVLKKCDHMVAVSNKLKDKMLAIEERLNIAVVHNGADSRQFYPMLKETAKQKLGINEANKIILFVGNLIPIKGINYLIEAFGLLLKDYEKKDVMLYLIGDGGEREYFTSLARNLSLDQKVLFLGRKPHSEIPLWMNIADIFVLPSISEGLPTVLVEAMMCGLPVIASNVGGIPEIVIHNKTGFIVEPKNSNQIKEYLKLLLDNKIMRKTFSDEAIVFSKELTWNNNAVKYINLYNNIISDQGP